MRVDFRGVYLCTQVSVNTCERDRDRSDRERALLAPCTLRENLGLKNS